MGKKTNKEKKSYTICPLAPFHLFVLGTLQSVLILVFVNIRFIVLLVAVFFALCLIASFFPRLSFFLPVVTKGGRSNPLVAITFDDGPDPITTPLLLNLLFKHSVKATFFLIGNKSEKYPELVQEILAQGHEIGNHSYNHDVFLMLRSSKTLQDEIVKCQNVLQNFCINPLAFRPPVGITNPKLFSILTRLGMYCACFSRRPFDFVNRRTNGLKKRVLKKVTAGDILALHDCAPKSSINVESWLEEVEGVISGIVERGMKAALLSEVIQRPVMEPIHTGTRKTPDPVRVFYDSFADDYDDEENHHLCSLVRREAEEKITERIEQLLHSSHSVMEIGAGTGRFTLTLSKMSNKVMAVDLSPRMLQILDHKIRSNNISNIKIFQGNISQFRTKEQFDMICSFSSFEYIHDLVGLFQRIKPYLKKSGILYFTTSNSSLFRFFIQIGNAMRQGIWMHARSKRKMNKILKKSGFVPVEISTYGLKSIINSGMFLEVVARKQDNATHR